MLLISDDSDMNITVQTAEKSDRSYSSSNLPECGLTKFPMIFIALPRSNTATVVDLAGSKVSIRVGGAENRIEGLEG